MSLRGRLPALLAAALGLASLLTEHPAAAGQQEQHQVRNDLRDLSPLPRASSDPTAAAPVSIPSTAAPSVAPKRKRGKPAATARSTQQAGRVGGPVPQTQTTPPAPAVAANGSVYSPSRPWYMEAIANTDLSYTGYFNGPSLGRSSATQSYNRYSSAPDNIYIYHTLDLNYHIDRKDIVGGEISAHHNLITDPPPSLPGFAPLPPLKAFVFNDPQLWYRRKSVLDTSLFSTDVILNLFPAVTDYSINTMGSYFESAFDTNWYLKIPDYRWNVYFSTRIEPTVYADLQPGDGLKREWMFLSAGYYAGYSLARDWQVNVSGQFDCDYYADGGAVFNRGDAYDDYVQLELNYFVGRRARIGAFVYTVMTDPRLEKSVAGLDVTVNFL